MTLLSVQLYAFFFISFNIVEALSPDQKASIDEFIHVGLGCFDVHAATLSIVQDDRVAMTSIHGLADPGPTQRPVTNDTIFGIASLTKAFTATLLLKVLDKDKRYTLNTRLTDILGAEFKFHSYQQTQYGTLKDLLSHRIGIVNHNFLRLNTNLTRQNLPSHLKYFKSATSSAFRASFYYNDIMYGLLARITEIIGGKPWETLMTEEILTPIGMSATRFQSKLDVHQANTALPYIASKTGSYRVTSPEFIKLWARLGGSGTILSNFDDMSKWMQFHLNNGKNRAGQQIVKADVLADMYESQNIARRTPGYYFTQPKIPVTTTVDFYALGWRRGFYRGLPLLSHTGTSWGSLAFLSLIPSKKIGVFTAFTGSDDHYIFRTLLHNFIWDTMLGETPWINATTVCTFPKPWFQPSKKRVSKPINKSYICNRPIAQYVGSYHNDIYGTVDVTVILGTNQLNLTYGFGHWTLYATRNVDEFVGEGQDGVWQIQLSGVQFVIQSSNQQVMIPLFKKAVFQNIQNGKVHLIG